MVISMENVILILDLNKQAKKVIFQGKLQNHFTHKSVSTITVSVTIYCDEKLNILPNTKY